MFASEEDEERFCVMGREVPVLLRYADELVLKCVTTGSGSRRGASIAGALHFLRHIRVLRIIDADLSNICLQNSWGLQFSNLENLALCKTSFRSACDVLRLALQFKQLRTLRVEDIAIIDDDSNRTSESDSNPSFEPLAIRTLHILNTTKAPTLPSLLSHL